MSFHNKPNYQIPELIEALKAHRLPHDTPSQLADSFRIGWMACRERAQADSVQEDAARYRWLRDQAHPDSEDSGIAVSESDFNDWGNKFTRYYSGEELDAAIDAARAADSGVQDDAARESGYRRGYRHGYEQRDAEVRGAMA